MDIGNTYKIVTYAGSSSETITGTLLAILDNSELRRYGYNGTELQTLKYTLLPGGTEFSTKDTPWYILSEDGTKEIIPIHSSWIKDNGIIEVDNNERIIVATFTSSKSIAVLQSSLVAQLIYDAAISAIYGTDTESGELGLDKMYKLTLSDMDDTTLWGKYKGGISYALLPSLGISAKATYESYTWDINNLPNISTFTWYVFETDTGVLFAMAKELLAKDPEVAIVQDSYKVQVVGTLDLIPKLRSALNIAGCKDITIYTTS